MDKTLSRRSSGMYCLRGGFHSAPNPGRCPVASSRIGSIVAGYSTTPLVKKLGIQEDFRVSFPGAPEDFLDLLLPMPEGVVLLSPRNDELDLIVYFTRSRLELTERFGDLANRLVPSGILWVGWPKKASKVETDLDENIVREIGLAAGLVDVKVCAIDDVWSGLKLVYRLKDRPKADQARR
jgi:hypothetical protein